MLDSEKGGVASRARDAVKALGPDQLKPAVFGLLRDLIAEKTGVHFDEPKRPLLADKLAAEIQELGLTSFLDYYYLLRYDDPTGVHWSRVADRLAVPETYFWRQPEQFEALAKVVAPALQAGDRSRGLRIWSAACCTGEEPISIAIALAEAGLLDSHAITIVGSDASPAMLERAKGNRYGPRSFRQLPEALQRKYFVSDGASHWRPISNIASRVSWQLANLVKPEETQDLDTSDVIFCRNVFIYFSDESMQRVAQRFAQRMPPHGHLFLGASESLTRLAVNLELREVAGTFVYVPARRNS
ncbi:MAG: CheR family methyltransferase [Gemmatimonadaceae bacterium]